MIVYADILFAVNFIIDYIIAFSTSKATYVSTSKLRLFLSSLVGGIYSIFMFEKNLSYIYSPVFKVVVSFLIILIAFKIKSLKTFFKLVLNYYIIAFSACGTGIFINNFFGVVKMSGSFFYFENNIILLVLAVVVISGLIVLGLKFINKNNIKNNSLIKLEIYIENKAVSVTGIMDTGNLLLDPITQYPVIVVDYQSINSILPEGIKEFFNEEDNLSAVINRKYINKIRLIPCSNVSGTTVLKGFKPDFVVIENKDSKVYRDIIIAVSYKNLSQNNDFSAILNPQL